MLFTVIKIFAILSVVLGLTEISEKFPKLAGFLVVLPSISLLTIVFSHIQYGDNFDAIEFYKGMLFGLPGLIIFYSSFLILKNFYLCLLLGFVFLIILFFIYKYFGFI